MNAFFLALERASWAGLALLAAAMATQWALDRRVPAAWRVWLWRAVVAQMALAALPMQPLRLTVLPALASAPTSAAPSSRSHLAPPVLAWRDFNAGVQPAHAPAQMNGALSPQVVAIPQSGAAIPTANSGDSSSLGGTLRVANSASKPVRSHAAASISGGRLVALIIYAGGLIWQWVLLWRGARRVRGVLRVCEPLEDARLEAQMRALAARLSIRRCPQLKIGEVDAPFLVGVFRPSIMMPRAWVESQSPHLESVLAHELAHLKRRDLVWNAPLWCAQTLFWFHPLTWSARRFLLLETESACDEMTMAATRVSPRAYGTLLLQTMNMPQTPLAAGVADGFFALQTRLRRLSRTPARPRRAAKVAFGAALVLTFGAPLPWRLVARAQTAAKASQSELVAGTVVDEAGKPVAGVTVYAMRSGGNGSVPLETTKSDSQGKFRFSVALRNGVEVLADAGERGLGHSDYFQYFPRLHRDLQIKVSPASRATLRLVDGRNRPVVGVEVRLWRVGTSLNSWLALPRAMLLSMRATTNARGEANFGPLPAGMLAQFALGDERENATTSGLGDRRGQRFAPLSVEDCVRLSAPQSQHTIRLLAPMKVTGRIHLEDGRAAREVLVWARRVTPAEERGEKGAAMDRLIAGGGTDERGNYTLLGLRPGKYWIWFGEGPWKRDWVAPTLLRPLSNPVNRLDVTLTHGAIIEGTVISQTTKQPVKGQTMGLLDSQENYRYAITNAHGAFRFRVLGGKQWLWVHANGTNSPPPGFRLPDDPNFRFSLKNGETEQVHILLPDAPARKVTTGTVFGPDGKPAAGAIISVEGLRSNVDNRVRGEVRTGKNGRFSVPTQWLQTPARLFARTSDADMTLGALVRGGEDVRLWLKPGALAGYEGQVVNKITHRPIRGVTVILDKIEAGGRRERAGYDHTLADGKFSFKRLPAGRVYELQTTIQGYGQDGTLPTLLSAGEVPRLTIWMHPLKSMLTGRVRLPNGAPAAGYIVMAVGQWAQMIKPDGTFTARVLNEKFGVLVQSPGSRTVPGQTWGPIWTHGGRRDVQIRLTDALLEENQESNRKMTALVMRTLSEQQKLVGQKASTLRVSGWSGAAPSFAGRVTLLHFAAQLLPSDALIGFARSAAPLGVQVVGVQYQDSSRTRSELSLADLDAFRRKAGIPYAIALDARNGQSAALYQATPFIVIGRDGKIAFTGYDANAAIAAARKLAKGRA